MATRYIFGNGLESMLVVKRDAWGGTDRTVSAREAFVAGQALAVLSILVAELDLAGLGNGLKRTDLGPAIDQGRRVLEEAGR